MTRTRVPVGLGVVVGTLVLVPNQESDRGAKGDARLGAGLQRDLVRLVTLRRPGISIRQLDARLGTAPTGVVSALWPGRRRVSCVWRSDELRAMPCSRRGRQRDRSGAGKKSKGHPAAGEARLSRPDGGLSTYGRAAINDASDARAVRLSVGRNAEEGPESRHGSSGRLGWVRREGRARDECLVKADEEREKRSLDGPGGVNNRAGDRRESSAH